MGSRCAFPGMCGAGASRLVGSSWSCRCVSVEGGKRSVPPGQMAAVVGGSGTASSERPGASDTGSALGFQGRPAIPSARVDLAGSPSKYEAADDEITKYGYEAS